MFIGIFILEIFVAIGISQDKSIISDTAIEYAQSELGSRAYNVYSKRGFRGQEIEVGLTLEDFSDVRLIYKNGQILSHEIIE